MSSDQPPGSSPQQYDGNPSTSETQQETAQRLSLALDAADLGDWDWDAIRLSPRATAIFGLPTDVNITRSQMRELLYEQDRPLAKSALDRAASEHKEYDIEYRVIRASDQKEVWVAAKGRGLYDAAGNLTRMLGVVQDITHRKEAEAMRETLLRQVESERARLMAVFKLSPSFMAVLTGPHHVYTLVNDRYYQLVGHRELIGRAVSEVLPEVESQGFPQPRTHRSGQRQIRLSR